MPAARRGATDLNGILLVDKPIGMSSHDVVDALRRLTGEGRIGHAGTLDPAASGLLVVCIGPATRLSEQLIGHDKTYLARIAFGSSTSTDDAEGVVLASAEPPAELTEPDYARIVLAGFLGPSMQLPPQFSAIKQQGVPAYRKARQGKPVELERRPVLIHSIELLSAGDAQWDIITEVSKGTYVRALARDVGEAVGCPAHLAELRRLAVGPWRVSEAYTLAALEEIAACGSDGIRDCLIGPDVTLEMINQGVGREEGQ